LEKKIVIGHHRWVSEIAACEVTIFRLMKQNAIKFNERKSNRLLNITILLRIGIFSKSPSNKQNNTYDKAFEIDRRQRLIYFGLTFKNIFST